MLKNSANQSVFFLFSSEVKYQRKCHNVADRKFIFLPWRRAECESWWSAHDCPLEGSHRTLTERRRVHGENVKQTGHEVVFKFFHLTKQLVFSGSLHPALKFPLINVCIYVLTFYFVGCSSTDLSFTVLQKILEGWDQIVLGDLRPHGFLELHSERCQCWNKRFFPRL